MADSKLTALTAETTVAMTDITYFVDDPSGTPLSRKCTIANLSKGIDLTNVPTATGAVTLRPAAGSSLNVTLGTTGDLIVNTTHFVIDTSSGYSGFGTAAPRVKADFYDAAVSGAYVVNTASTWRVLNIRNDQSSSSGAAGINFQGNNVNGDTAGAAIIGVHNNTTGGQTELAFITSTSNAYSERMRINSDGNVGVNDTTPDDKFHITVGTTDAVECLKLEQLDVSEGFANFVSTSAANTTNPITTWTTGGAIAGFVRVEINGTDQWMPFYSAPTS